MNTKYSEKYYRENWDRFMNKKTKDRGYINLEEKLEHRMSIYEGIGLPDVELKKIENIEAKRIIDEYTSQLKEQYKRVKDIEEGRASLGYTTMTQETEARGQLIMRFEFNCLQLADFKKAHFNEGR